MDITLSNIPAVTVGLWLLGKFGLIRYDYFGKAGKDSILQYDVFRCHKRFGICIYMILLLKLHFLNGFFINNNLLIPPYHPFPVIRLLSGSVWDQLGSERHTKMLEPGTRLLGGTPQWKADIDGLWFHVLLPKFFSAGSIAWTRATSTSMPKHPFIFGYHGQPSCPCLWLTGCISDSSQTIQLSTQ